MVWRRVTQTEPGRIGVRGTAHPGLDRRWACEVLGAAAVVPAFDAPVLRDLALQNAGMRQWSSGSLYEGFVSSIVGQSISVAAAAVTERKLCALFHPGIDVAGRRFWPTPRPDQIAEATIDMVRSAGVTQVRAHALVAVGQVFADEGGKPEEPRRLASELEAIRGIGRWTIESALLWGIGHPDAHPSGDVALLRAARRHFPGISNLQELDRAAETWKPNRAWAARLLWLDLLGFPPSTSSCVTRNTTYP
ncbi:MAG: hypothetical protein U0031_23315 [Thermomicrobiales bacterium]